MNVIMMLKDKQYILSLIEAKRLLNCAYKICKKIKIQDEEIEVGKMERDEIMKQLHGQIYV